MNIIKHAAISLALLALAISVGGCVETQRAKTVKQSGFLEDYSRLQAGAKDEALLRYRNPSAELAKYDKILIAPVQIFKPEKASEKELKDLRKLAGNFHAYLMRELEKDYQIVQTPEPGVLKIETAITGADKSGRVMDFISTIGPPAIVISSAKEFSTGKPTGVGEVSAEMRITDAASGEILGEAVDRRVGGKDPSGMFNAWNDADKAMQYWAKRVAYVLCKERGGTGCVKP